MVTTINGLARLGSAPELKYVGDDKKPVCEMRARFVNSKQDKVTGEWKDQGFWAHVNIWDRYAEPAAKMFSSGDMVYIDGNTVMDNWPDKENQGQTVEGMKVNANFIAPYLPHLESLTYQERKAKDVSGGVSSNERNRE